MNNNTSNYKAANLVNSVKEARRALATEIRKARNYFKTSPNTATRGFTRLAQNAGFEPTSHDRNTLIRLVLHERLTQAKRLTPQTAMRRAQNIEDDLLSTLAQAATSTCKKTRAKHMSQAARQQEGIKVLQVASRLLQS